MIDIDEIRRRINEGKRKWSKPLLQFIAPKLNEGYTYEYVSQWLAKEHNIIVAPKQLIDLKSKHIKYEQKRKKAIPPPVTPTLPPRPTLGSSVDSVTSNLEQNKEENNDQPIQKDYRRKTPDPRKLQ